MDQQFDKLLNDILTRLSFGYSLTSLIIDAMHDLITISLEPGDLNLDTMVITLSRPIDGNRKAVLKHVVHLDELEETIARRYK